MEVDRPTTNGPETIIHGGTFNSAGRDIIYNIQNVQTRIEAPHDSSTQELQKILDWLSLINFRDVQAINYDRYTPETVRWFLEGEMLETFLKSKRSVICGTGMPGAGKTTLAAAAVKEAQELAISSQTAVNFVYCRYTDPLSVEEILAAMVRQLVEDHAALARFIEPLHARHSLRKTRPSRKELVTLLTELIGQFEAYNCFLDGLDEAVLESQETLLNTMKSLPGNLLVTTRPLGFLEDLIPDATFFKVAAATEDIERLVSQKIQENSRLHKLLTKHGIKDEVVSKIRDTANGMFLHASLQIEMIRHCTTRKSVMEKLEGLPISLNEMYSLTLERILSQPGELADLAKRVLCWVVYAKDPLTLEAIKNAVSSHTGNSPFDVDAMEDEETLISVCFGLVVAEDPGNIYTLDDGEIVSVKETRVKLIHYTAQDALESLIPNKLGSPHALLAEACVTYLTGFARIAHLDSDLVGLQGMEAMEHVSSKYPFYHYAWLNLGHHCKEALQLPTSAIDICSTRRFILSSCPYPMLQVIGDDADYAFDVAMSPIHVAAWYNMLSIFNDMVDDNGNVTLSSADNISGVEDHFDFLGLFKDVADKEDALQAFRGEWNINERTATGRTALMIAACSGFDEAIDWLLRFSNIEVNAEDNDGRTAFVWASYGGHVGTMRRFLELPGVDVGSEVITKALMLAREPEVGDLLLSLPGLDPNARDADGKTALMLAIPECKTRMVSLLLSSPRVDANARDNDGKTALMQAVSLPEKDSAWILMNHPGIEINARDPEGRTALMLASLSVGSTFDVEMFQDLLRIQDIDQSLKDNEGNTALALIQARIQETEDSEVKKVLEEMIALLSHE